MNLLEFMTCKILTQYCRQVQCLLTISLEQKVYVVNEKASVNTNTGKAIYHNHFMHWGRLASVFSFID